MDHNFVSFSEVIFFQKFLDLFHKLLDLLLDFRLFSLFLVIPFFGILLGPFLFGSFLNFLLDLSLFIDFLNKSFVSNSIREMIPAVKINKSKNNKSEVLQYTHTHFNIIGHTRLVSIS